ncbi:MAG: MBL fold metallo-hydrolase [Holophagales bacterium]|nr:MBL fold metallo-hydrolase [Holophagales bacterium]MYF96061.1 MBL fold metallo-hydrolase [Holophagales bacterium]
MTETIPDNRFRQAVCCFAAAALSLTVAVPAAAQLDIDAWAELAGEQTVWERTRLSDTVYLLLPGPGRVGNLAVSAGEDGILIVDDGMIPVAPKIKAAVAEIQEGKIDFVVNSHYHFDHAGGNAAFGADSAIVAHANVRKRLLENRHAGANFSATPFPPEALPIVTFNESVTLHWNDEAIDVIHFGNPAHTDGDSAIYFRDSNVLHAGDQYINLGSYPYIDRDVGGSALGLRENLAQMLDVVDDETKIIPGHGPLATKADLQKFHDVVSETIDHVADQKKAGKSLQEVQGAGLPEKYASYRSGGLSPEAVWIGYVWASLDD